MRKQKRTARRQSGATTIVEFGPTMWVAFILIVFPLLAFGSLGLRYTLVNNAVGYAAEAAAQASQFYTNQDTTHLSSVNAADAIIDRAAASWSGITINKSGTHSALTQILMCKYGGTTQKKALFTPLTAADMSQTGTWIYTALVTVDANINPLLNNWKGPAGSVPGLNAPIRCAIQAQRVFESIQGLKN